MRVESVVEESVSCEGPRSARNELDDRTGMPEMLFARSAEHIKIRSENSGKAASKLPVRTYRSDAGGRGVMARAGDFGREVRHKFPTRAQLFLSGDNQLCWTHQGQLCERIEQSKKSRPRLAAFLPSVSPFLPSPLELTPVR